jgi:hypothetical protein
MIRFLIALAIGLVVGAASAVMTIEPEVERNVVRVCPVKITGHRGIWLT